MTSGWLTPNTPSGATVRRVLVIPDTYLPAVNGALEELTGFWNWEANGNESVDSAVERMLQLVSDYYESAAMNDINGGLITLPIWRVSSAPNGWAFVADTTSFFGGYWEMPNHAQNDSVSWSFRASPGTWQVEALCMKNVNLGIATIQIDGVTKTSLDLYGASLLRNQSIASATFQIDTEGTHTLKFLIATKNASSNGYGVRIQGINIRQTA